MKNTFFFLLFWLGLLLALGFTILELVSIFIFGTTFALWSMNVALVALGLVVAFMTSLFNTAIYGSNVRDNIDHNIAKYGVREKGR